MKYVGRLLLLGALALGNPTPTQAGDVTSGLMAKLQKQGKADAVLALPSVMGTVLSNPFLNMMSGAAKASFMTGLMKQMTTTAQTPFLNALQSFGVESTQPFWITNKISMKGVDLQTINALKSIPGVFSIREPFQIKLIEPDQGNQSSSSFSAKAADEPTWGVQKIGAPSFWSKTKGEGVLVANIDTGVAYQHEALKDNYAGQFHDSMEHRTEPYDDNGHGTHVMGTICGQTNGIGVAPGARWVACKGLGNQGGDETTLTECAQWILNLDEKPAVVANSWGGGQASTFFNDEIAAWRAVNIIPVFAIGNEGSKCETAASPGDQPKLISVGATKSDDTMAGFSSRGPLRFSNKKVTKPEVSAPGQGILSAWPDGDYETLSGTSMACPHVAGAIALMRAVKPDISFDEILKRLTTTTLKPTPTSADLKCGGTTNGKSKYPNNAYGSGIINVAKAMAN